MFEVPWYKEWFSDDYYELYHYRDFKEAKTQVDYLFSLPEVKQLASEDIILDIACGTGRHLENLQATRKNSFGLDLSIYLLNKAYLNSPGRLVLGNMLNLPILDNSISLLTSFFTSFGYFNSITQEKLVLKEFNRVLKSNGLVFFDLANKDYLINSLVPREIKNYSGGVAHLSRRIITVNGETRVEKIINICKLNGQQINYKEEVTLFSKDELSSLLTSCNFSPLMCFGGFDGSSYSQTSPRLVMLAKKI